MGAETSIQWTDATWNPVRGCSRVSPGCEHCYAETMASRFTKPGQAFHTFAAKGRWTRKVELVEKMLDLPLHWKTPRRIFVNSMSDLFHESLGTAAITRIFQVMASCPQHTFQILTKRAQRMREFFESASGRIHGMPFEEGVPLPNVWLGVSVEDQRRADERIPELLATPAAVRFLSCEPLLGPVNLRHLDADGAGNREMCQVDSLTGRQTDMGRPCPDVAHVDWVIVGGESGAGARPFDLAWARSIVSQCKAAGVPVFVKQLGAVPRPSSGVIGLWRLKDRKGGDPAEWPEDLRVREFPR